MGGCIGINFCFPLGTGPNPNAYYSSGTEGNWYDYRVEMFYSVSVPVNARLEIGSLKSGETPPTRTRWWRNPTVEEYSKYRWPGSEF